MIRRTALYKDANKIGGALTIFVLGFTSLLLSACNSSDLIKIGDPAPPFTLSSENGLEVSLSDYQGKQPVLLYFHMAKG